MKIQIVYIDPEDDFGSIRDKLLWTKSPRALLVWPGRGTAPDSQLDLVLLKRTAIRQGIVIGLLSHDPRVQALARKLAIPLFEDLNHLPESNWSVWDMSLEDIQEERPTREIRKPGKVLAWSKSSERPIVRLGLLLLPISLFLLGLILLAPGATVEMFPTSLREIETLTFTLAERSEPTDLLVAYEILDLEAQGEWRIPTTGSMQIADEFARGEVEFSNLSDDPIEIPAGAVVRGADPEGPRFRTEEAVSLLVGEGAPTSVGIIAIDAGPEGNVVAESITTLEGAIGLQVAVINPEPTRGGSSQSQAAVSTSDRESVREQLLAQLRNELIVQALQISSTNQYLLENSLKITQIVQEDYDAEIGALADSLQVSLTLKAQVITISNEELRSLIMQYLDSELQAGYTFVPGSPTILTIREIETDLPTGKQIEVEAAVRTYLMIDEEALVGELRGTSRTEAMAILETEYPGEKEPLLRITPAWYPWMPLLEHRIDILLTWEETA